MHKKIAINKNKISNITRFEKICEHYDENIKEIKDKINRYQSDLENFKLQPKDKLVNAQNHDVSTSHQPMVYKNVDYSQAVFNHDVIFLVDSNLGKIKPEIMDTNKTWATFFCPTMTHIDFLTKRGKVVKQPSSIFIHCGTNDLSMKSRSTENLEDEYIEIISKVRNLFPNTKIIISSLLPRMESSLKGPINYINDFLNGVCASHEFLSFMRNINIKHYMLVDHKHISSESFLVMLSNIRYKIFNKLPSNKLTR